NNYLDLVACSSIADSMDITEKETRYYVYEGLKKLNNPFLKHLAFKNIGHNKEVYPLRVSFKMANYINAVIRAGDMNDKETMVRAMLGEESTVTRISKYRGVEKE